MSSLRSVALKETEEHDDHIEAFIYLRCTFLYYTIDSRLSPIMTPGDSFAQLSRFVHTQDSRPSDSHLSGLWQTSAAADSLYRHNAEAV